MAGAPSSLRAAAMTLVTPAAFTTSRRVRSFDWDMYVPYRFVWKPISVYPVSPSVYNTADDSCHWPQTRQIRFHGEALRRRETQSCAALRDTCSPYPRREVSVRALSIGGVDINSNRVSIRQQCLLTFSAP